jgi:hypothetical protein
MSLTPYRFNAKVWLIDIGENEVFVWTMDILWVLQVLNTELSGTKTSGTATVRILG